MKSRLITTAEAGVFVIAVTPFDLQGQVLESGIAPLVDFYLNAGVTGITILGMMGEAEKLLTEEAVALTRAFLKAAQDRVPIVVGVSSPGLIPLTRLAHQAMDLGAAGVMVAPTPNLKHDAAVFDYFVTVCEQLGPQVPVVIQDYPQATGVQITVGLLNKLIRELPQVVMLKHEDCPGLTKLSRVRATQAEAGRRISILVGNGGLYLPQELARGADGAMTGFAYPEMLTEVVRLARSGNAAAAEDLFDAYLPLVRYEQQPVVGLAVRKEILYRRKVLETPALRRPGYSLSAEDRSELDTLMARLRDRLEHDAPQHLIQQAFSPVH